MALIRTVRTLTPDAFDALLSSFDGQHQILPVAAQSFIAKQMMNFRASKPLFVIKELIEAAR